ncbi:hypothetical protein YC2023_026037 [Brassica napus]
MSGKNDAAKTGKIAVWWDMKDCPVPEGIDDHRVRPSIEGAFKEQGYSGPVSITAYGDQKQTPDTSRKIVSLTGDLTSPAQLRLSLWFVTSLPQFVAPLHSVSRASACGSSHLASGSSLLRLVTTCGMSPLSHPSPLICEPGCLYDLDLMPNNSDDNCISHQSLAQQQHRIVGVDLVDSEGDLVMAEGRDSCEHVLRALSSTGVAVVHIGSESTCAVMYLDMVKWREDNPPPATMMIITNQMLDVFNWDLARLQQRTSYNIFLAYSIRPVAALFVYTRKEWLWEKLLHGTTSTSVDTAGELSTVFHCEFCSLDCQSVKSFKKHLSTKKHAIEEVLNPQPTQLISVTKRWGKNYAATPEYATAKIHVSWDMSECPIPDGYDARRVRPSLEGAFKELGYSGPVSITAFGDHKQTPERHLHALSSTGIDVAHALPEFIYSRMFDDLKLWRDNNPTPTTMMIISDGAEYLLGGSLARLKQLKKYNLFWAYSFRPWKMSVMLTSAEWLWDSLLAGRPKDMFFGSAVEVVKALLSLPECFIAKCASLSANAWINS